MILAIACCLLWIDRSSTQARLASAQEDIRRFKETASFATKPVPTWFQQKLYEKPALETSRDTFRQPEKYER
jgi:hypothetical protein